MGLVRSWGLALPFVVAGCGGSSAGGIVISVVGGRQLSICSSVRTCAPREAAMTGNLVAVGGQYQTITASGR